MNVIDKALTILAKIPTTQARIVVTIGLTVATGIMYFATAFVPGYEWLGFLALMSGLDVAQFHSKRKTAWTPAVQNGHNEKVNIDEIIDEIEEETTTDNPEIG
ncbi:hypothetical protein LCGC14_1690120 [marine sediment metagenome]|uniref:Uncharacterized protein n=1 Tax=marine sediment metagenome TaxID=412755 RepID=A0A0F9K1N9_9ZZZZ